MRRKLFGALCCALILAMSVPCLSLAEETTVYVAEPYAAVYASPAEDAEVVAVLYLGESAVMTAYKKGWARLRLADNTVGYAETDDLSKKDVNKYSLSLWACGKINIYGGADVSTDVLGTVEAGDELTGIAISRDNTWCRVTNGKILGYVKTGGVTKTAPAKPVAGYVKTARALLYEAADTTATVQQVLYLGDEVSVKAYDGKWATVTYGSTTGAMLLSALSKKDVNRYQVPLYVKTATAVYAGADTGTEKLASLAVGTKLTGIALAKDKSWCRVTLNGQYGYVQYSCLTTNEITDGKTVWVADTTIGLYASDSTSSEMIDTMSFGETLRMLSYDDAWALVMLSDGTTAYAKKSGLSKTDVNTASKKLYVKTASASVYTSADTGSVVLSELVLNDALTCVALSPDKAWVRAKNGSGYGYVQLSCLSSQKATDTVNVYAKSTTVNVYATASTSAIVKKVMGFGEAASMATYKKGWALVTADGVTGYIPTDDLTKTNPNTLATTGYAQVANVKVYALPDTTSTVIETLSLNESVKCVMLSSNGKWLRVKTGSAYGYVASGSLADKKAETSTVYVTDTTLPVYSAADELGTTVCTMSFGESLTMMGYSDGWAFVKTSSGYAGYCLLDGLTATDPNTLSKTAYANGEKVNIYARPDTTSSVIGTVKRNFEFTIQMKSSDGEWCRVRNSNGSIGYMKTDDLSTSVTEEEGENDDEEKKTYSESMASLIALALSKQGCKYVYATQGPNTFDCSGFTNYLYRTIFSITLSRSAYGQGYQTKYPIITSISDLKPGDVLCFNTNTTDDDLSDHVGLYLGNDQFIHASCSAGKVIISNFTSYYKRVFFHAFRPVET